MKLLGKNRFDSIHYTHYVCTQEELGKNMWNYMQSQVIVSEKSGNFGLGKITVDIMESGN